MCCAAAGNQLTKDYEIFGLETIATTTLKTTTFAGVGTKCGDSAGLQPARLISSGNRVFTRRMATASIGLKPMRLAMHHTRQKHSNFTVDQTTAPAPHT